MNEKVDINNIIEVSHTKHTKKNHQNNESDDDEEDETKAKGLNEEDKKYHENVISDIYGSISSEDEDEEENSENLDKQIEEEAKLKEEELK